MRPLRIDLGQVRKCIRRGTWSAGRVSSFVELIDPPLYSRRHFITCMSYQPPKLFPLMRVSDEPGR
jgi:hypothetical protein